MRKLSGGLAILICVSALYIGSIAISVSDLVSAARSGDANRVLAQTDLDRLRRSIVNQIVDAYLEKSGPDQKPMNRMLANTYGASVVDAMLTRFLTPENIVQLLRTGAANDPLQGTAWEVPSIQRIEPARIFDFLARLRPIQITEVELRVSENNGSDAYSAINLHLDGLTWKLSGIRLPRPLIDKLVLALPKR